MAGMRLLWACVENLGTQNEEMAAKRGKFFRSSIPDLPDLTCQENEVDDETEMDDGSETDSTVILSPEEESPPPSQMRRKRKAANDDDDDIPSSRARNEESEQLLKRKDLSEWSTKAVKEWAFKLFQSEEIAQKFEDEDVDGETLHTNRVLQDETMHILGLITIGKKSKFTTAVQKLKGTITNEGNDKRVSAETFKRIDRLLTNKEKDLLPSAERSIYNTKKKRILAHVKKVWPEDQETPWFRNNAENTKKLNELVERLSLDESCVFPKAGLGRNAIEAVIRKQMQERRRKEKDPIVSGTETVTSDSSSSSPESQEKRNNYAAYFNKDLSAMSALAIVLEWLEKETVGDLRMQDLREESKSLGLRLLRNKDKNTHINAIASTLLKERKVVVTQSVPLNRVSRQDVTICKP